jgi:hypothetical protein
MLLNISITTKIFENVYENGVNEKLKGINYFKKYGITNIIAQNITSNNGTVCVNNPYNIESKFNPWAYNEFIIGGIFYSIIFDRSFKEIYIDNDDYPDEFNEMYNVNINILKKNQKNLLKYQPLKYIDYGITKKNMKKSILFNSCVTTPIKPKEIKHFYIIQILKDSKFKILQDLWV